MVDIFLCVFAGCVFVALWCASTYFMIYFQHPSDINTATFAKLLLVLSLSLASGTVLMLPLDVAQRNSHNGGIPMDFLWLCDFCLIALLVIIILPFGIFFYEADDASKRNNQCGEAVKVTFIVLICVCGLYAVLYIFLGFSDVPVEELTASLVSADSYSTSCENLCATPQPGYVTYVVSIVTFLIAVMSIIGWILLVIFGGIGFVGLPVDLINSFRERPHPINIEVYKERIIHIGECAEELIKQGFEIQSNKKTKRKDKNYWKKRVLALSDEFEETEIAYKLKGGPTIVYAAKLVFGIFGTILTILWIIQICIWTNTYFYPFLNYMLIAMDGVWEFFGTLFFAIFAYWLLWCVISGNYKWGIRVPLFFTIHPMKPNETLMNSMLVNVLLILIASVAATHLCAASFSEYARITRINSIFNIAVNNLRGLYWFWYSIQWVLIGITGLAGIYFIIRPSDKKQYRQIKH